MKLSVLIPVFNEEKTIAEIIHRVMKVALPMEIIVVNDGSTDNTGTVLQSLRDKIDQVVHLPSNRGKGAAIAEALKYVTGDVIVFQDADLEYDPVDYYEMYRLIQEGQADFVLGSRMTGAKAQRCYHFWHMVANKIITFITNILYNTTLSDTYSCYKMFRTEIIRGLTLSAKGFEFDAELLSKVLKNLKNGKLRVYEVPIFYYGRTYEEGKKIKWYHTISVVWMLIKFRFVSY